MTKLQLDRSLLRSPPAILFVFTLVLRIVVLSRFANTPYLVPQGDDMYFYHSWALRILGGQWTDHQAFYGLPGYAFLLALVYKVAGVQPFAVGLIQALVEAFTATVVYQLARGSLALVRSADRQTEEFDLAQIAGVMAALGWAFFLPAATFSVILMPTCWLVLAFWALILWLMRTRSDSLWRPWLPIGAVTGLVAVFVATVLFLWPMVLWAVVRNVGTGRPFGRRWLNRGIAVAVYGLAVFAGASPAWIHNYFIAQEPVLLSAHSGLNLWIGNNPVATGYPRIPPGLRASQEGLLKDSITLAQKTTGKNLNRAEVSRFWSDQAKHWIRENRSTWFRLLLTKFANFWNALQYDDLSIIKLLQNESVLLPGIRFGLVATLGLAGMVWGVWRFPRSGWIAAGVLLHMLALLPVFITERYRMCAVPGLLIFSSALLTDLWRLVVGRRWGICAIPVALTAISASFVSIARPDPSSWSLDHYKAGIRSIDSGNLIIAENELTAAYAYVPDNAEISFALGNLRLAQGNSASAKLWYRRTLELNPNHAGAWNNTGAIALQEQRWDVAERLLERAIAAEPEAAKSYYLLARARIGMGNRETAEKALNEALRLNANQKEFVELMTTLRGGR